MVYVLDTSSLIVLGHYFPNQFRSFWKNLNALADVSRLISVSEVWKELDNHNTRRHLTDWLAARRGLFSPPSTAEMIFVSQIFAVSNFQSLVRKKNILEGSPVADPWVIASAAVRDGCVVTEEMERPNTVRIPTVCRHFNVECTTLEGLMSREGWEY